MKILLAGIISAAVCLCTHADEPVFRTFTRFQIVEYEITVSAQALASSPRWDESVESPPLSIRKAQAAAIAFAKRTWEDGEWRLDVVSLKPMGPARWLYIVRLMPPVSPSGLNGFVTMPEVVVLMDGTVAPITKVTKPRAKGKT